MTEKKRGRPKGEPLPIVLPIKGTSRWRLWIEKWANQLGLPSSVALVDQALKEKAEREGHDLPPSRTGEDDA